MLRPGAVRIDCYQLALLFTYICVFFNPVFMNSALAQVHGPPESEISHADTIYNIPSITATYRDTEIDIDGVVDEKAWQKANSTTRFLQREPVEGALPEEKTEVRVLYGESALYVGAKMYDSKPHLIGDQLVRRDQWGQF
ncbi:uncharacterized protein METZ01_LOCUS493333, partial [marine metagenome]